MRRRSKWIAVVLCMTVFAALALGSGSSDSGDTSSTSESTETTDTDGTGEASSDGTEKLQVGDTYEDNGLKFTINSSDMNYQPQNNEYGFYDLDAGYKYVAVSFTFENTGSSDAYVSIYDFDCYADNTNCEQKYLSDGGDFMNTNLSAGRNVSFTTYYAVPEDAAEIELEYTSNIWTSEKVVVQLQ